MVSVEQVVSDPKLKELMREDDKNLKWLHRNYKKLLEDYPNAYIAIRKQEIIDHDRDVYGLITRLKKKLKETDEVLIYFISSKKVKFLF